MTSRIFCFRFDVDSHRCASPGMPNLMRLADELDVRFTFFVNMGRLTSRPRVARKTILSRLPGRGRGRAGVGAKLPLRRKFGTAHFVRVMLLNPRVGSAHPAIIREARRSGHEIGLHGGHSHRAWQDAAPEWPPDRISREVDWGLHQLSLAGVTDPEGFSSPGWSGSDAIERIVADRFRYVADYGGRDRTEVVPPGPGVPLTRIPTNVLGEPGGIGYVEWHRARGSSDEELAADFRSRLERSPRFAVVYDHPFWAGIHDLSMTRRLIGIAREQGFHVAPMRDLLEL